jgi:aminoglycoside phosphotransferase (APT) family kinase protein
MTTGTERRAPPPGRDEIGLAVVVEVATALDLDVVGARVTRSATSVLVELPHERLIARLDDAFDVGVAERQVAVARVLADRDVPAVRLAGPTPASQPVRTAVGGITFWHLEEVIDDPVRPAEIGALAQRLHDTFRDAPPAGLPPLDPLVAIADQLHRARRSLDADDRALDDLKEVARRLATQWPDAASADPAGQTLVHGDLHAHNVLSTTRGPVLADLELAGVGPASYDLVPQVVAVRRYGRPFEEYEAFADAYGWDVREWAGSEVLAEVYELWVTMWAVANRHRSPRHRAEAIRRLQRWRHPDNPPAEGWELL